MLYSEVWDESPESQWVDLEHVVIVHNVVLGVAFFFFFKQKTASEIDCDWSSDVCSSDLGPTLLVCPMSLVGNWQREAARFTPDLRVHVHYGADRLDGDSLASALAGADLVITTYGVATRDRKSVV